jgi:hypothetical protein
MDRSVPLWLTKPIPCFSMAGTSNAKGRQPSIQLPLFKQVMIMHHDYPIHFHCVKGNRSFYLSMLHYVTSIYVHSLLLWAQMRVLLGICLLFGVVLVSCDPTTTTTSGVEATEAVAGVVQPIVEPILLEPVLKPVGGLKEVEKDVHLNQPIMSTPQEHILAGDEAKELTDDDLMLVDHEGLPLDVESEGEEALEGRRGRGGNHSFIHPSSAQLLLMLVLPMLLICYLNRFWSIW